MLQKVFKMVHKIMLEKNYLIFVSFLNFDLNVQNFDVMCKS